MRSSCPGKIQAAALAAAILAGAASGEVADSGANGFSVRAAVDVPADPAKAYAAAVDVAKWWDSAHTYSQDAKNLTLEARPGGCFCERLAGGGGVQHLTVVYAQPGKALRLQGGLGPLQALAAAGTMTWTFQPAEKGAKVELTYAAGGYRPGGFAELAPIVDKVLGEQLERYRRFVEGQR
jgi:hypothetical protein